MSMWEVYAAELAAARETWTEGDLQPIVVAVAAATGLEARALNDWVEMVNGWGSCDDGYEHAVWFHAWELAGHPDWAGVPASASG